MRRSFVVLLLGILFLTPTFAIADEVAVHFNRDVQPILSQNCFSCHGPDEAERQSGVRLDTREGALAVADSGSPAVVAGNSAASLIIARITSADPAEQMPPPESGKSLTPEQIETLKKWVDAGAEYQGHWSFVKPERPEPPTVANEAAVRNPIDQFVLRRLEQEGLSPSPEADKATLIRRVTLELTGLPPTLAEVDAFLADSSPDAYEKVVDRLLASPRYGEHMARYWLDLVRYGDTHGLHLDNERALWKYREWVINALNENKPFDQFTIEQLAGDLLPSPTIEQQIATGFNRCNVTTSEGGSIDDEVLVRYAVDRTETMSTIFLGLTAGCAVCHDHKFDPISQKEFYQLFAFYNAAADAAMDGNALAPPPILNVPTPEQTAGLADLDAQLAAVRQQTADALTQVAYTDPGPPAGEVTGEPQEYVWIEDATPPGAQLQGDTAWEFVAAPDHPVFSGEKSTRRSATALSQHFFTGANPGLKIGEGDKLFAYVYLDPANPPKSVMLQFNDGSWEHRAYWGEDAIVFGAPGTPGHVAMGPLPAAGEWVRLEVEAAKVGLAAGATLNGWAFTQFGGTVYWDKAGSVTRTPQNNQSFESLAAWAAYEATLAESSTPQPVRDAVKVPLEQRTEEQTRLIREHFLQNVYLGTRETFAPLQAKTAELTKQRDDLQKAIPVTLVMADLPTPRDTHILVRGEYDKKGVKVTADVPAALPALPADAPRNRLGLARWLVSPEHPLTARVAVNRYWQHHFGVGLVKTADDFGAQGEWPSHPDLLDWLAVEFRESGWNVKQMHRLMVTSATYRQSSHVTPDLVALDPENILLARGPRFRLDAEAIRDSALFMSGLLVESVGGRSVKPYQPPGIWESVAFVGSNTSTFQPDAGDALYRRSLYTFWKRTAPPPSLMAFDAPSREICVARRARTNTPLQALVLMNDVQYVEASRALATRIMREFGATPAERLTGGFRLVTSRAPQTAELDVLVKLYEQQLAHYQSHPDEANKLLVIGQKPRDESLDLSEHAALTLMANLLLNLDESITKE